MLGCLLWLVTASLAAGGNNDQIDLSEFGRAVRYEGNTPETLQVKSLERGIDGWEPWKGPDGEYMIGLEFDEPRDIAQAGIEFRHAIADRNIIRVEYWKNVWPSTKTGGWAPLDDPFHGEWAPIKADWWAGDREVNFQFRPLNEEPRQEKASPCVYRRTYRLRFLLGKREQPPVRFLRAFGPHAAADGVFEISFDSNSPLKTPLNVSTVNGFLLDGPNRIPTTMIPVDDGPVALAVRYAVDDVDTSTRTIVTLRSAGNEQRGLSFLPAEAATYGSMRVPALGTTITYHPGSGQVRGPATSGTASAATPSSPSIFDRVGREPEQTFERARRELPELSKSALYLPLGPPESRQEIPIRYGGSTEISYSALKVPADDGEPGNYRNVLHLRTGEPAADPAASGQVALQRLDGYLPIVIQSWQQGGIAYEQTSVATYLKGEPKQPRGDEEVVLLCRMKMTNPGSEPNPAAIRLTWQPRTRLRPDQGLTLQEGYVLIAGGAKGETEHLFFVQGDFAPEPAEAGKPTNTVVWQSQLTAGQTQTVEWRVPFGMPSKKKKNELAALDFDQVAAFEADRWRKKIAPATVLKVPDPLLNDFWKSTLVNLWITADKDPFNGMTVLPAGTFGYNVCLNESCIQIRSLEMRGLHADAQRYLDAMMSGQSSRPLHGRFTDQKGVFLGMPTKTGDYQTFNYCLDQGFVLWELGEHYHFTHDKEWLKRAAPAIVEGCNFVIRQSRWQPDSNTLTADDRNWGVGLLPPGHLEDPPEWLWWYAVNAYAWRGMQTVTEALRDIGHRDADNLTRDVAAFGENLRRSCKESMLRAPVVRLRDGTYVPFQPTRSRLRGRDPGWIRDALYGPIHLIDCGVYPPDSAEAEWILRDAEDNVFIGPERGYELKDFENQWFSWGGMTLQPNLLPIPTVYQQRAQRKHALRSFYNTFCASVYADARCFAEWVPNPGTPGGPLFKPPDESAFIIWLRELLVKERGDDLDLLAAMPMEWLQEGHVVELRNAATWFGPMDLRVQSRPGARELSVELVGPQRNPPKWIRIHAGMLGKLAGVTLDGKDLRGFDVKSGVVEIPGKAGRASLVISY